MGTRVPASYITGAQSGLGDWSSVWVGIATMLFFFFFLLALCLFGLGGLGRRMKI